MKKNIIRISALVLLLCLSVPLFCSCLYIDDRRAQTAYWSDDGNAIEYGGKTYVRLANNYAGDLTYLRAFRRRLDGDHFDGRVAQKDVPLLVAYNRDGRHFDWSVDGNVIVVGNMIYVEKSAVGEYEEELEGSNRTGLCYIKGYGEKTVPVALDEKVKEALGRAEKLETAPAFDMNEAIYSCTDKMLLGTEYCNVLFNYSGEMYVTFTEKGLWEDYYRINENDVPLFADLVQKELEFRELEFYYD